MTARRLLLAALALLAACKSTSTRPSIGLSQPSAVAVFRGLTSRDAANVRTYFAVANEGGGDLRLLDAVDGKPVLAPALVQSLSVVTAPRPAFLAAGGLADADPSGKVDLLAVAPAGLAACDPTAPTRLSGCVQIVATWVPATALSLSLTVVVDDLPGGADAGVLSLAVVPVPEPDPAGGFRASAGRVRVVAGLTGGRLLLADYARATDGVGIVLSGAAVHALGFDPISLSGSPDLAHLYAASLDPIAGVEGVAELDLSGPFDQAPVVRAIPAGLPTTLVLAARVRPFVALGTDPKFDQHGPEVIRVYAALDPERCGRDREVTCGLAVLDPVSGAPVPDPAGELPSHLPIAIAGRLVAIGAVYPPLLGSFQEDGKTPSTDTDPSTAVYQTQAMASSDRLTSTLAVVASSTGAAVLVDLARGVPAIDREVLATTTAGTQARITVAASSTPSDATAPFLGLWDERTATPEVTHDTAVMPLLVRMTPGYTPTESWTIASEAILPNLSNVRAQVQSTGTSIAWLATQASASLDPGTPPYRDVVRLYDPRLFLRPGDIAAVSPADTTACPRGTFELEVTGFLPPDDTLYPGGAVTVVPRPEALQPQVEENGQVVHADPHCLDGAGFGDPTKTAGRNVARVTFRSGGLLLTGLTFGYGGRPALQATAAGPAYTLAWEDTSALSCPVLESPAWPPAACDQACRDTCERIILARRARRSFYVAEQCATTDTDCTTRWGPDPVFVNRVGPVLSFKVGQVYPSGADGLTPLARGTTMVINTNGGDTAASRRPLSGVNPIGAVLPSGVATFDGTAITHVAASGVRVLVAYPSNLVLEFTPAGAASAILIHK